MNDYDYDDNVDEEDVEEYNGGIEEGDEEEYEGEGEEEEEVKEERHRGTGNAKMLKIARR